MLRRTNDHTPSLGETAVMNPLITKKNKASAQYGRNVRHIDRKMRRGFNASNESNMTPARNDMGKKKIPQTESSQNHMSSLSVRT
jgi:hypothetical protein